MTRISSVLALLGLAAQAPSAACDLVAVRKLPPDANAKLYPTQLVFASPAYTTTTDVVPAHPAAPHHPAYALHLRRHPPASPLRLRSVDDAACPALMSSCEAVGQPSRCCEPNTVCTPLDDTDTDGGTVGAACSGRQVADCPADAVSCAAELGGGCCIPGYVCHGMGCIPAPSPPPSPPSQSSPQSSSSPPPATPEAVPPWRPTSAPNTPNVPQPGCPTGFYGCLAVHGGGCCQTDRQCHTLSCPPLPSQTVVVSNDKTVVVVGGGGGGGDAGGGGSVDGNNQVTTATCAQGWLLCASDAGPVPGCCPSGFACGTASCFAASASHTATASSVRKEEPKRDGGAALSPSGHGALSLIAAALAITWNLGIQRLPLLHILYMNDY